MDKIKQTITLICMVLTAALFCVQTVSAGSMNAGDSFDTATEIEQGFYEDEVTEEEEKYSYIEIKPGQEFIFKTTFDEYDPYRYCNLIVEFFDMDRSKIGGNKLGKGESRSFYYLTSSEKELYGFYIRIKTEGSVIIKYHTSISIEDHFDANSETDAGDNFNDALSISPGNYEGHLARRNDQYIESYDNVGNDLLDYYKLPIQSGDKVTVTLTPSQEASLRLSIYNEDRECVKTEESKETGSIARTQWLADSSQYIFIQVKGVHDNPRQYNDAGDYTLDITTGKAPAHKPGTTSGSESKSQEQPGFEFVLAIISLAGVYIGLRKKVRK